jgi:hypothetical protein
MEVEFDNQRWQEELRNVVCLRQCQFPARTEIEISGSRERVTITMKEKGLQENMQTDAAAVEGWALALLQHCGVKRVQIELDPGAAAGGRHYQRLLYRLQRFAELFPECDISKLDAKPRALGSHEKLILNQPNPRKVSPEVQSTERMLAVSREKPTESDLEMALEISNTFRSHFQLEKVMRQWPVGLFCGKVARGNEIFTGGKSAIDLIGIRNDTLVLFELKKAGNRKVGAISELLFYASVMRDAIGASAIFEFKSKKARGNCAIGPEDILRCSKICAVLLAPDFHPLISEPGILAKLNEATERLYADRPIHFETAMLSCPNDKRRDFEFRNGRS